MLDDLAPGYDVSEGYEVYAETYAHAAAIASIWDVNERLANQLIPARMLENLTIWEGATGRVPAFTATDNERRSAVAAKMRGLSGNSLADIGDAAAAILGDNFVNILTTDEADAVTYWPGGPVRTSGMSAPGPPGFEWSTNRVTICIVVTKGGLSLREFTTKRDALRLVAEDMIPAWQDILIGIDEGGFICDVGTCDETLL